MLLSTVILLQIAVLLLALNNANAVVLDFKFKCGVCRAIVIEANWKINQIDPKKMVAVGGYRIDSDGNQHLKTKMYARSESHLEDMMENICTSLEEYAEVNNEDGTAELVRFMGIDGTKLDTDSLTLTKDTGTALRYQCQTFLEHHIEDVIGLLRREHMDDYEKAICGEATKACTGNQLSQPMRVIPPKPPTPDQSETKEEDEENYDAEKEEEEEEPVFNEARKIEL